MGSVLVGPCAWYLAYRLSLFARELSWPYFLPLIKASGLEDPTALEPSSESTTGWCWT